MSATPTICNKRGHLEVAELTNSADLIFLLRMNRSLEDLMYAIESDVNFDIPEEMRTQKLHEYPLMVMIQDADARALLLSMLRHENFGELCNSHGIKRNGQSRGDSTRLK